MNFRFFVQIFKKFFGELRFQVELEIRGRFCSKKNDNTLHKSWLF